MCLSSQCPFDFGTAAAYLLQQGKPRQRESKYLVNSSGFYLLVTALFTQVIVQKQNVTNSWTTDSSIGTRTVFLANTQKGISHCFTHHNNSFDAVREAWGENTIINIWGNTCGDSDSKHEIPTYTYVHIYIDINHSCIFKVLYLQIFYAYINIILDMYLAERFKKRNIHNCCKINYLQSKTSWNSWEPILSDKYFLFTCLAHPWAAKPRTTLCHGREKKTSW